MNKLIFNCPTLDFVKETLSSDLPDEIEMTFENKEDNIVEFAIISYLVNDVGYSCDSLHPVDDSNLIYVAYFKRKS